MIRDRVRELRYVPAAELRAHERNWRRHPARQRDALRSALERIGFASAVLAYESGDELKLIDGHLRADLCADAEVPVLVLDVTDEEADKLLAILDPIGHLAGKDEQKLAALLDAADLDVTALVHGLDDPPAGEPSGGGRAPRGHKLRFADETVPMTEDEFARLVSALEAHGGPGFFLTLVARIAA